MRALGLSLIALAVSAGYVQSVEAEAFVSDQAEAKGFVDDAKLNVLLRNSYFNQDGKSGAGERPVISHPTGLASGQCRSG